MTESRPGKPDQWDDDGDEVLGEDRPPNRQELQAIEKQAAAKSRSAAETATNLFIAGFDWATIADRCDYASPRTARVAVEKVLADVYSVDDRVAMRNGMSAQLDALLRSLAPKALHSKVRRTNARTGEIEVVDNDEHLPYAAGFARVLEQKARLHGLNAPQVVALVDPTAEQFESVLRQIAADEGVEVSDDVDIFDLEEGEDGVYRQEGERDE